MFKNKKCFSFLSAIGGLLLFLTLLFPGSAVRAEAPIPKNSQPTIVLFWGDGCPHCAEEEAYFQTLLQRYPGVKILTFEVWHHPENVSLLEKLATEQGIKVTGVPVTFFNNKAWVGFKKDSTAAEIETELERCSLAGDCGNKVEKILSATEYQQGIPFTPATQKIEDRSIHLLWVGLAAGALLFIIYLIGTKAPLAKKRRPKIKKSENKKNPL